MKKTISILLMSFCCSAFAQPSIMRVNDLKTVVNILEQLPSITENKYVLDKRDTIVANYKPITFHFSGDEGREINIRFIKILEGSNPDLEIKGNVYYTFDRMDGLFLDLFPFWKEHFDSNAKMDELLTKGRSILTIKDSTGGEDRIVFNKDMPLWSIVIRH